MALLSTKTGLPSFSAQDASIVNYFTDPGFERGIDGTLPAGWLQYNDGAVAVPVDGTGGSANVNVTLLTTTAGAIRGTKSALLTKGPGNQQGTGYAFDFPISPVDKGVTAGVEFEMVTSSAYVSGDVVFYIYDVTNSTLITPRAVSLPKLDNYGKFFTDYGLRTGTQYRFILHIATTNASAWTITLDTMVNSTTRTAVPGAPVTEEADYTLGTFVNTPPASTMTLLWAKWRQVGNFMQCRFKLVVQTFNYSGSAQAGNSIVIDRIIPSGYTIASEIVPSATRNGFGSVSYYFGNGGSQNANSYADGFIEYDSASGGYRFFANQRDNAALSVSDSSVQWGYFGNVGAGANNGYIQAEFFVPIDQFTRSGTNYITDNVVESNARVRYYRSSAYSYTASTTFVWDAVDTTTFVTNGNWTNSSGEISVPATGLYSISTSIQASVLLPSDPQLEIWVSRQGGAYAQERVIDREAGGGYKSSGSASIYMRLGDKFQIRLGGNATVVTGTVNTFLEVFRVTDVSARASLGFGEATATQRGLVSGGTVPGSISGAAIGAGYVGEFYEDASTTLFTTTTANIISRTLQAGVWRIAAHTFADTGLGPIGAKISISTTSATHDTNNQAWIPSSGGILSVNTEDIVNISSATTYYVVGTSYSANVTNAQRTRMICHRIA